MNILPKKNWHVRRKENVERVRRDEAEAKAQEEELKRRAEIAEREAKIELMKKRVRERDGVSSDEEQKDKDRPSSSQTPKSINFFSDLEQGIGVQLTNVEHDAEKKAEQEKIEKRIGLLNYLVDKDKSEEPWYSKKKTTEESAKSKQRKETMDPMNQMKDYLTKKRKADALQLDQRKQATSHISAPLLSITYSRSSTKTSKEEVLTSEKALHHTHKHKHKKHKKHKQKLRESISEEKKSLLEKLRQERQKREQAERTRSEAMLKNFHGDSGSGDASHETASSVVEKPGRYFSQFNPHLTRQHRADQ